MKLDRAIRHQASLYVGGSCSLSQFEDWFLPQVWDVEESDSPDAEDLAKAIMASLSEFSSGLVNEEGLKDQLRPLLRSALYFDIYEAGQPRWMPVASARTLHRPMRAA